MRTHNDGFLKGSLMATGVALVVALAGCSDGGNDTRPIPVGSTPITSFFVAQNNGAATAGQVELLDHFGTVLNTLATITNRGIAFDRSGNLVQAGDTTGDVGVRTFCSAASSDGTNFREIAGASTTLTAPRGVAVAQAAGYYFVADGSSVLVFYTGAAGDVAPVATVTTDAPAWDVAYDETSDTLFVSQTDGTVAVFDTFVEGDAGVPVAPFGADGTSRTITPVVGFTDATPPVEIVATDLRGIAYDAVGDRLVVSDVGDTASNTDGAIYVIADASSAGGDVATDDDLVEASIVVSGASTGLGNPVDVALRGHELRVAEQGNGTVLYFQDIFLGDAGDRAPDDSLTYASAESVAFQPTTVFSSEVFSASGVKNVAVTNNSAGTVELYTKGTTAAPTMTSTTSFDASVTSIENVAFDANGDAYATFDANTATAGDGGIAIIHRLNSGRDGETFDAGRDRTITGTTAGLVAPRGIAPLGNSGYVAVAETDAAAGAGAGIYIFNACGDGDIAPLLTVATAAAPWDMDYDPLTDRLYVALTNGTVEIYRGHDGPDAGTTPDGFVATLDPANPPTPSLTLDLSANATNLHGIAFRSNRLFLSDVGLAGDATDGKLFIVTGIAALLTANPTAGSTAAIAPGYFTGYSVLEITGDASTVLGNPVDLAYDGANLFVANKTGTPAGLLKYNAIVATVTADDDEDDVPDLDTDEDGVLVLDADIETTATEAESVALVPTFIP